MCCGNDAFATAEVLASWWDPEGFTNTFDAFEFSVGGQPVRRVVIRHDCRRTSRCTVQLSSVAGGTHLTRALGLTFGRA